MLHFRYISTFLPIMAASYVEIPDPRLAAAPKVKKFEQVWVLVAELEGIPKFEHI